MPKSFYDVLGVAREASQDDIKRAYKKLARKYHPDRNQGDPKAEEHFKEIGKAFAVLSDAGKRAVYDELGQEAEAIGFDPDKAKTYRQWASRRAAGGPEAGSAGKGGLGVDLGDILDGVFSRGRGGFASDPMTHRAPRLDVAAEMSVPFREAVCGGRREIRLMKQMPCASCGGLGTRAGPPEPCRRCGGAGQVNLQQGPLQFGTTCIECRGTGRKPGPACTECGGVGTKPEPTRLDVEIPAGIDEGQKIRLRGQGLPNPAGGVPGDLLITVHVAEDRVFKRDGDDLRMEVPITVAEALLGAEIEVPTLEGRVKIKVPAGTQTGAKLRLRKKGVKRKSGEAGDLYVVLSLRLPDPSRDPEVAKNAAELLQSLYEGDIRSALE